MLIKTCYCHTCGKWFHYLGITRHRAMHLDKREDCVITFTNGNKESWAYSELPQRKQKTGRYKDKATTKIVALMPK
jgi:hypothetical protein